jgi:hypothetical protein
MDLYSGGIRFESQIQLLAILTKVSCDFSQSLQTNSLMAPPVIPWLPSPKSMSILPYYFVII